jgi:SAM-dependent methyltransferase
MSDSHYAEPEFVELWDADRIRMWQDYHLSGMPDLIGSVHLCHALLAMASSGLVDRLQGEGPVPRARLLEGLDHAVGAGLLRYLTVCGVLEEHSDAYRLTRRGQLLTNGIAMARLGFYLEAYGPVTSRMSDLLTGAARYGTDVVRGHGALGRHSGTISTISYIPVVSQVMRGRRARRLVDLGCGTGGLLVQLCQQDAGVSGVGIDIAADAIEAARQHAAAEGVASRASFEVADAFDPGSWPGACDSADVICAVGVLHEKFRDGDAAVINLINQWAKILTAGRTLLIGEPEVRYDNSENDSDFFLVHVLTAQGIPRDRAGWTALFRQTELRCERVYANATAGPRTCFYELTRAVG